MATRHQRFAPVSEYQPSNITAATTAHGKAIGALLDTTTATTVAAGSATITLAALNSFVTINSRLAIYGGTGTAEIVQVTAVNYAALTITAVFANTHSGTNNVTLITGTKLGTCIINAAGTTMVLVLWNGQPDQASSTKIGTPTITAGNQYPYQCAVDQGLWAVYTGGAAGDLTITYLADAI